MAGDILHTRAYPWFVMLAERCSICSSRKWCGRPCLNKPEDYHADVNKVVPVESEGNLINANAGYQAKWRKANTELNRQRAKEGMRKRRAGAKANA